MIEVNTYQHFDAATVSLDSSNLIEASAGTGKTYSIAILVLRLILEQKLSIKEILMVTFTKAAVAELEDRIRLFIRRAYKVSYGFAVNDEKIENLVIQAVENTDVHQVRQQLRDTILLLDETAVLTIHSFCQQTLTTFAFETNQLFGAEMVPDLTPVIEDELNKYWRKNITTLHTWLLQRIWIEKMRDELQQVITEHLSGKKYLDFDESIAYAIDKPQQLEWVHTFRELAEKEKQLTEALHQYIHQHADEIRTACMANRYAKKNWPDLIADPEKLIAEIKKKRSSAYIPIVFPEILEQLDIIALEQEATTGLAQTIRRQLYCMAIKEVGAGVRSFKERSNMLGYDDLITNLHNALVKRDNPQLIAALQEKYKAVFVDEFQDTDRQQFEIFDRAFGQQTILFYIGDPKQSIYAWRKADIFTYFNARNSVQHLYDMNLNFRSAANLITAMNQFFQPKIPFDTFYFEGERDSIEYIHVDSPPENKKGFLYHGAEKVTPIIISESSSKDKISMAVATQVAQLLQDQSYRIGQENGMRSITPSDIGILVRTGKDGKLVKDQLARLGIPAVTIDDAKVLDAPEALYVLYLLEAMETPDRSSINRALLSPFTGFDIPQILKLDDEVTLSLFSKYRDLWQQDGAYTAIMAFIADFGVRHVLLDEHPENGERIITNLFQLTELVHQVQSRKNLSMRDLISWLKRGIDGMATTGDEYAQRVESDEEAVNIVTIHKSKGLEYKIVLAPFLDFVENSRIEFVSFRDPDTGDYSGAEKQRLTDTQQASYKRQQEQENRRLIYVAVTRAVYACYLYRNTYYPKSSLTAFTGALLENMPDPTLIRFATGLPEKPAQSYRQYMQRAIIPVSQPAVAFQLEEENWRKMSYTMLAAKAEQRPRTRSFQQDDTYDNFIFNTLRRGAKTGNLLHFIFENINFSDNSKWDEWLEEAVRRFVPGQRELYLPMLLQLLQHVFQTTIDINGARFQLASVGRHKRLAEFEFDFPVPVFQANLLNHLSDDILTVGVKRFSEYSNQELEGIMNGKVDLFFEHGGRYYILDWKSNYLGSQVEDYAPENLAAAMNEHNYHLQYLIYTVAVKKYLESRIPGFDYNTQFGGVVYLFVRGVRNNSSHGIFTAIPSTEKISFLEQLLTGRSTR
ncbi:exodeoxyribonuclease V subunit beta [Chitinophaga nivalis]|uniref:RecBCD enzyme subunit RecB n=1 Tax=Chitinophaga nivalis TaxID=2991709 RepID=A0ABT3IUU8_9BACT|nr:exodeoxyribonuclease V subunit beta [Chitinophaga nivalis]MCW3462594.1 exodeoxyribonuclease V subunit beta [Chitinophaga nivalis]MCW3487715.1 exodeoxyribonuclease V subunit beta [Chitinophaga nivalis]